MLATPARWPLQKSVPCSSGAEACLLEQERAAILRQHAKLLPLEQDLSLDAIAAYCVGYTGADLAALCRQAAMRALAAGTDPCIPLHSTQLAPVRALF